MTFDSGHALLIGIGSYQHEPKLNVPLTATDAQMVAEVLCDPHAAGYPAKQVTLLKESQTTRAGILSAFDTLANDVKEGDTVLVFYSGHGGHGTDSKYYLTTYETKLQNGKITIGNGIAEDELLQRLRALKAKRALLIFNACHSGAITPSLDIDEPAVDLSLPDRTAMAMLGTGEGRVIITACRETQRAYFDRQAPTTIFTRALIDGLRGIGISSRHGYISVFDLYGYVYDAVSSEVRRRWDLMQEPELTIHKGIGAMAVALYPDAIPDGNLDIGDRPRVLGGVVKEVDPKDSEAALQQILSGTGNVAVNYQIDARGSQGLINNPTAPVSQIWGGTFNAPLVGSNESGTVTSGDQITVGDITHGQGIAIGRSAHAEVHSSINSSTAALDPEVVRSVLKELHTALGQANLPIDTVISAQTAAGNALVEGVKGNSAKPDIILSNVQKAGETLKQANVVVQEGSTLWQSVKKLASVLGPLVVGGARVVAAWFGVPL